MKPPLWNAPRDRDVREMPEMAGPVQWRIGEEVDFESSEVKTYSRGMLYVSAIPSGKAVRLSMTIGDEMFVLTDQKLADLLMSQVLACIASARNRIPK